jgi:hypothetical protein
MCRVRFAERRLYYIVSQYNRYMRNNSCQEEIFSLHINTFSSGFLYLQLHDKQSFKNNTCSGPFHTHFMVRVILIVIDPTVTVKCRTAIKALFLYFNLCLSVMLDSLSCSFTSIFFRTYTRTHIKNPEEKVFMCKLKISSWQELFLVTANVGNNFISENFLNNCTNEIILLYN